MSRIKAFVHLAVGLFVAPTPGLMALAVSSPDGSIPVVPGLIVMLACTGGYLAWAFTARPAPAPRPERETVEPHAEEAEPPAPLAEEIPAVRAASRRHEEIRSFEDLPDPLAASRKLKPVEILIDRVSDIQQVKRVVQDNRVHLLTSWHRQVRETSQGERHYGDWAVEADRLLLSASFMARTLTRHEAIALVTAEVAELARQGISGRRETSVREPLQLTYAVAPAGMSPHGAYAPPAPAAAPAFMLEHRAAPPPHAEAPTAYPQARPQAPHPGYAPRPAAPVAEAPRRPEPPRPEPARAGHDDAIVSLQPQVAQRRCAKILECGGWRTTADPGGLTNGIDLFAERDGRIVGLRCVSADDPLTAETVEFCAEARRSIGTDIVAIVTPGLPTREVRAAAAHAGVLLLEDSDLSDLAAFLPEERPQRRARPLSHAAE